MKALYGKIDELTRRLTKEYNIPLSRVRFGCGQSTYFSSPLMPELFVQESFISYGKKKLADMVSGKFINRDYKRLGIRDVRPAASIALVILHEVAHAQDVWECSNMGLGHRPAHGIVWEAILHDMSTKFLDDFTLEIAEVLGEASIESVFNCEAPVFSGEFSRGSRVVFNHYGAEISGKIVRKGKLRWTVRDKVGRKWYVPERFLKKADNILD